MRTKKLLFRWVGANIEKPSSKKRAVLTHTQRQDYLKYLDDALDPHKGLFAKIPSDEYLGRVTSKGKGKKKPIWQFHAELPCLCFTELDLGDSEGHVSEFGRLGFGFTKQFIVSQGGGPVQYCLGSKDCPRVADLARVRSWLLKDAKDRRKLNRETSQAF